jgi:hypothetical protein
MALVSTIRMTVRWGARGRCVTPLGMTTPWRGQFHDAVAARLNRLRKESEKQIPRGLKPARDDKNKRLVGMTKVMP